MKVRRLCTSLVAAVALLTAYAAVATGPSADPAKPKPIPIYVPCDVHATDAVTGGGSFALTVTLSGIAEVDQVVNLATDHPEVLPGLPVTVVVPAGWSSVTVRVKSGITAAPVTGRISAYNPSGIADGLVTVVP